MTVRRLDRDTEPGLAAALAGFERTFWYPLGPDRRFRIDHGEDYGRFYASMGPSAVFVATRRERVVGVLSAARRTLRTPQGDPVPACYLGDVKVDPRARGGAALWELGQAALAWAGPECRCGFGVVMDGTGTTPDRYSGRAGLPGFEAAAAVALLRVPVGPTQAVAGPAVRPTTRAALERCFDLLARGTCAVVAGDAWARARSEPVPLVAGKGEACGLLEDTLRAKRLFADDGAEIVSAHLSSFAGRTPEACAAVVAAALTRCRALGVPALFAAVSAAAAAPLLQALGVPGVAVSGATVYAGGLAPGTPGLVPWTIHSSEI